MNSVTPIRPGLVSVTFRPLPPEAIVRLAADNGLAAIEWGGDVHCPHGDADAATRLGRLTRDAGLDVYAYGSYYRVGGSANSPTFDATLRSAVALGAPVVRVWAGTVASADATQAERDRVARDLEAICDAAAGAQVDISLEYHGGTLTDEPSSAVALLRTIGRPNLFSYWQPRHGLSIEQNLAEIEMLRPWLRDVHVFHWWPTHETRHPLAAGADRWAAYLQALASDGRPRVAAFEFMQGDRPEQLTADAVTLRQLLADHRST